LPVNRDAYAFERGAEEIGISVGKRHELEAALTKLREGAGNLRKRTPRGKRVTESRLVARRELQALLRRQPGQRLREHLAIPDRPTLLDVGFELVVAPQE